ncbi:MAG: Arc family DNA-binding protein [Eubacterium sp.]|nr:Arc family DNA-binding protein [Eubacterium sp.]
MANKNLFIHIDKELLDKLHHVANQEGKSANGEILMLIKDAIKQHEQEHGEIPYTAD